MSKLPTKKELMKRLQDACDVINGDETAHRKMIVLDHGDHLRCGIDDDFAVIAIDHKHKFRPDVNLPKKGRTVINRAGRLYFSKGEMDPKGGLKACSHASDLYNYDVGADLIHWRDFLDPTHHSNNWKEEWNYDLKGEDND